MSALIPSDFTNLRQASTMASGSFINVIGLVTDAMSPKKTSGTDYMLTFTLADDDYGSLGMQGEEGLKIRFFNRSITDFPPIQGTGDVVILRQVKKMSFSGMQMLVSNHSSHWIMIGKDTIPVHVSPSAANVSTLQHAKSSKSPTLSFPEQQYAIKLCNLNSRDSYGSVSMPGSNKERSQNASSPGGSGGNLGFRLIKQIDEGKYYDLVAQVIKVYHQSDRVELYVSDYTSNDLLFFYREEEDGSSREGDEFGYADTYRRPKAKWPGPWGKMTLTVSLFPPHSHWAQTNVKTEDFVLLQNVHVKFSKDAKFEGVIHTHRWHPDKIGVKVLKDYESNDEVKDVLRRKREYWKRVKKTKHNASNLASDSKEENHTLRDRNITKIRIHDSMPETTARKRNLSDVDDADDEDKMERDHGVKPTTKNKKRRKKKPKHQKKGLKEANLDGKDAASAGNQSDRASKPNGVTAINPESVPQLNSNIRCAHSSIAISPLAAIKAPEINLAPAGIKYAFPFRNVKSRATVRIIDFFPNDIEDFAFRQKKETNEFAVLTDDSLSDESAEESNTTDSDNTVTLQNSQRKWIWGFKLLLQDAHPKRQKLSSVEDDRLWVTIGDKEAEFLLQLDAVNFRKDAQALDGLREKLFLLWGDLEERKKAQPILAEREGISPDTSKDAQNLPFQCCLKEYGVKIRMKKPDNAEKDGNQGGNLTSDAEDEDGLVEGETGYKKSWTFERRWMMWGCSIA